MYKIYSQCRTLAIVTLLLLGTIGDAAADAASGGFGQRIAGSYLIVHDSAGGSRDVVTIGADGIFLLTSSDAGKFKFSNSQGAWTRIGRRAIAAKMVNFDFDDHGVTILRFEISFDRRYRRVTGNFSGAILDESIPDPLNVENVPVQFSDGFTGRRITVDRKFRHKRDTDDWEDDDKYD